MEACLHPTGLLRRQGTRRALKSPPQSQGPWSPVKPHPQPSLPPPYRLCPPHGSETRSPLSRSLVLTIVLPLLDSLLTALQPTPPRLIASPPPHHISGSHSSPLPSEKHGWEAQKELGDTAASPCPIDPWVLSSRTPRLWPPRVLDVPSLPRGWGSGSCTGSPCLDALLLTPAPSSLPSGLRGSPHSHIPLLAPGPLQGNCLPMWRVLLPEGPHLGHQGPPLPAHLPRWRSF